MKQEHQLGTEDYSMFLELDRPMELNMIDMNKLKLESQKKQFQLDKIEIETKDYIDMRNRLKDLEMQKQLLQS